MRDVFQYYLKFEHDNSQPAYLKLTSVVGKYRNILELKKTISIKCNHYSELFIREENYQVERGITGILNPFATSYIGMGLLGVAKDAIMIEVNPKKLTIEFFIAEGKKGDSLLIYNSFLNRQLDDEKAYLRSKSQACTFCPIYKP